MTKKINKDPIGGLRGKRRLKLVGFLILNSMNELQKMIPSSGTLTKTGWELPTNITKQDWFSIGNKFSELSGAVQWAWGDWWNSGQFEHGERKQIVESEEWSGLAYQTLKNYGDVSEKYSQEYRYPQLSFRHHMECSSLPIEEAIKVLDWAVENKASTRSTAEKVKEVKSWLAQGWTTSQLERKELIEQGVTVVANQGKNDNGIVEDAALIAWADQRGLMEDIGRTTMFGNPFVLKSDGDRDEVCDNYENHYVPFKPSIIKEITKLKGKVLKCWCFPKRCHGDHLKDLANGN